MKMYIEIVECLWELEVDCELFLLVEEIVDEVKCGGGKNGDVYEMVKCGKVYIVEL